MHGGKTSPEVSKDKKMASNIEVVSSLVSLVKSGNEISDTILQGLCFIGHQHIETMEICNELMKSPSLSSSDVEIILHYSTELYNNCRAAYQTACDNQWNDRKRSLALPRYASCLLLHVTSLNGLLNNQPSKQLVGSAPDILRAYEHTSSNLKECGYDEEYKQCFSNAIGIIDQMDPILNQINTGASFYTFKEAEYDVLMEWVASLIPSSPPEQCIEILKRIRDDCVKYLPDLKYTFVSQV